MFTPSDRVQVRKIGELRHPGTCALCGNATCLEGYVDLDIYYEYEGNVYLCMNCVKQVCFVVGALLPDESKHLNELNLEMAQLVKSLKEQLSDYQHIDTLISRIAISTPNSVSDAVGSVIESVAESEQPDPNESPSVPDAGESKPEEPTAEQGPVLPARNKRSDASKLHL